MFNYDYLIVFDFETTGLNPEGNLHKFKTKTFNKKAKFFTYKEYLSKEPLKEKDIFVETLEKSHIIELGLALYKITDKNEDNPNFELVETVDLLVKQDKPLDQQIIALTHITNEMLEKDGVSKETLYKTLKKYLDMPNVLWSGYNIQFDLTFINELVREMTGNTTYVFEHDVIDGLALYKDFYSFDFEMKINNDGSKGYYGHRLDSAVKNLHVSVQNTHRALDDVLATFCVIDMFNYALKSKFNDYINKFGFNKTYGYSFTALPQVTYIAQEGGSKEIYNYLN